VNNGGGGSGVCGWVGGGGLLNHLGYLVGVMCFLTNMWLVLSSQYVATRSYCAWIASSPSKETMSKVA
jgi:hypothetical protein